MTPSETETRAPDGYITWNGKSIPVWNTYDKNPYKSSAFSYNENGFLVYDDATYTCRIGIDVSKYQGNIDWAAVKAAGRKTRRLATQRRYSRRDSSFRYRKRKKESAPR